MSHMLQMLRGDVAGCCRVLQGVAGRCRVLQGVTADDYSVHIYNKTMQGAARCCRVLQYVAVCCSVLQCGCCGALRSVLGWCRVVQGVAGCCSEVLYACIYRIFSDISSLHVATHCNTLQHTR